MTIAEQIIDAVMAKLSAAPVLVGGNVWRSRLRAIPETAQAAIVVRRRADIRQQAISIGRHHRTLTLAVEIYTKGDEPDALADPITEQIMTRMMQDRTLGGLVDDVIVGSLVPEWQARDTDMCVIDMEFNLQYESLDEVL